MEKNYKELYEQALEKARILYQEANESGYHFDACNFEEVFPELRDSEDEKIRKGIIRYLKQRKERSSSIPAAIGSWIDWLEKQGEQKPITDDKDVEKAAEEYRNFRMACGIKDPNELSEIEEAFYEGAIRIFDRMKEQKPAEWSEEDERLRNSCISHIEEELERIRNDKYGHSEIISDLKESCRERINWLISLRPRSQWKPSEEQIELLKEVQQALLGKDCHNRFTNFMYELKKL